MQKHSQKGVNSFSEYLTTFSMSKTVSGGGPVSKTEKNSYPSGACIVLRQRERCGEEEEKGEKISSIVNKC